MKRARNTAKSTCMSLCQSQNVVVLCHVCCFFFVLLVKRFFFFNFFEKQWVQMQVLLQDRLLVLLGKQLRKDVDGFLLLFFFVRSHVAHTLLSDSKIITQLIFATTVTRLRPKSPKCRSTSCQNVFAACRYLCNLRFNNAKQFSFSLSLYALIIFPLALLLVLVLRSIRPTVKNSAWAVVIVDSTVQSERLIVFFCLFVVSRHSLQKSLSSPPRANL